MVWLFGFRVLIETGKQWKIHKGRTFWASNGQSSPITSARYLWKKEMKSWFIGVRVGWYSGLAEGAWGSLIFLQDGQRGKCVHFLKRKVPNRELVLPICLVWFHLVFHLARYTNLHCTDFLVRWLAFIKASANSDCKTLSLIWYFKKQRRKTS